MVSDIIYLIVIIIIAIALYVMPKITAIGLAVAAIGYKFFDIQLIQPNAEGLTPSPEDKNETKPIGGFSMPDQSASIMPKPVVQATKLDAGVEDRFMGRYVSPLADDQIVEKQLAMGRNARENLVRQVVSTNKYSVLPYFAEELDAAEKSIWWENQDTFDYLM